MRILHGAPYARTNYVIWTLKELGLEYENIPVNPMRGETKTPEYMALNPNGLIPTLEEDDLVLWESTAINFYLAKNYGDGLFMKNIIHGMFINGSCRENTPLHDLRLFMGVRGP